MHFVALIGPKSKKLLHQTQTKIKFGTKYQILGFSVSKSFSCSLRNLLSTLLTVILSTFDSRTLVKWIPETLLALELVTLRTFVKTVSDLLKIGRRQIGSVGDLSEGRVIQEHVQGLILIRVHTTSLSGCPVDNNRYLSWVAAGSEIQKMAYALS